MRERGTGNGERGTGSARGEAPSEPRERLARLLGIAAAAAAGLALVSKLLIGGAAADLTEPSLNLATSGFLAAALFLAAIGAAIAGRAALPSPRVAIPLALLVATAWLSLVRAEDLFAGLRRALDWTAAAAFAGLALSLAGGSRRGRVALLAAVLAAGAVIAGLAWRERLFEIGEARAAFLRDPSVARVAPDLESDFRARLFTDQASGPFVLPNGLGAFLAVVAVAAGGAALAARSASVASLAGLGALAAASILSIPLAGQKGPYLGLAAGAAIATARALGPDRRPLKRALAGGGAGLALALIVAFAAMPVERLERLPGGISLAVRKEYAETALRMAREAPLLGAGAGNYRMHATRLKPERGEESQFAHDDYLEVLAEQGPLGLLGLAALWIVLLSSTAAGLKPGEGEGEGEGGRGIAAAIGAGGVLAIALLPLLGLRYREPETAASAAAAFAAVYALLLGPLGRALERAPRIVEAGAAGAAGAFAVQSAIDFLHPEGGLLAAALALAAAGAGPALARRRALGPALRLGLPVAAAAAFGAVACFALPRAIAADSERAAAEAALEAGRFEDAERHAAAALEAVPFDLAARIELGESAERRGEKALSIERYRAAIDGRRGLSALKLHLATLLDPEEAAPLYEAAVRAYPGNPRTRYLAGLALARRDPAAARAHLEAALRLDPIVRHERIRLKPAEVATARALLDRLGGPSYNGDPSPEKEPQHERRRQR